MQSLTMSLRTSLTQSLARSSTWRGLLVAAVAAVGIGATGASAASACPIDAARSLPASSHRIDLPRAQALIEEARIDQREAASLRQQAKMQKLFGNWLDGTRSDERAERLESRAIEAQNEACDLGICTFRTTVRPPVVYVRPARSVVIVHDKNPHRRGHEGVVVHR